MRHFAESDRAPITRCGRAEPGMCLQPPLLRPESSSAMGVRTVGFSLSELTECQRRRLEPQPRFAVPWVGPNPRLRPGTVSQRTTGAGAHSFVNRLLGRKYCVFAVFASQEASEVPFSFPALREKKTESSFLFLSLPYPLTLPQRPHYSKVLAGCGAVLLRRAPHSLLFPVSRTA